MLVFLNDRFVRAEAAKVSVFDPGFLSGEGLFETILIKHFEPQFTAHHLSRMKKGAKELSIRLPFADGEIEARIRTLAQKNKLPWGMCRVTVTPQSFVITTREIPPRPASASVCFVPMERCLPHIKSLNYLPSVLAANIAAKKKYDEALLMDRDGLVSEGTRTNVFYVAGGVLFTPPLGHALSGVTRRAVIALAKKLKFPLIERETMPDDIRVADEVFLTNAPMEIWPVTHVEKIKKPIGEVTQKLSELYHAMYG